LQQMELTFNLGVGMIAVVPAESAAAALALAERRGVTAWQAGSIESGSGAVRLVASYRGAAAAW
jgi:phosphoribosylformylglycinamidine cyclo-ligase